MTSTPRQSPAAEPTPGDGSGSAMTEEIDPREFEPGADGEPEPVAEETEDPPSTGGLRGHRLVWLVAGIAVFSLAAGIGLSTLIKSPAEQAAEAAPPEAGVVTAPVEQRLLANDVAMRADAAFEDSVDVKVAADNTDGASPVVTGQVPEVGKELNAGNVALEVSGRPIVVLPGELPAYRTLVAGSTGPDVAQLKTALRALGIDPGRGKDDAYDAGTASAVQKLYASVGYTPPSAGKDADEAVSSAQEAVTAAQLDLDKANADLAAGPENATTDADRLEADNTVRQAERDVAAAQAEGGDVAKAQDDLALARVRRADLDKPANTSSLTSAVTTAKATLRDANTKLAEARERALTPLPVSEVLFLANTPRRVDAVNVKLGGTVEGSTAVMSVSGASLLLEGSVAEADAKLLAEGNVGTMVLPDDSQVNATVTAVELKKAEGAGDKDSDKGSGRYTVKLQPDALTPEQVELLRGQNVRVTIPVNSTDGEVIAVPIAALTAGSGGESRVTVDRGNGETDLITVSPGLAADGFVEITDAEGKLEKGDKVVVGK